MMITDKCPICHTEYPWNSCNDYYEGAGEQTTTLVGKTITLSLCPIDNGVIAIQILDENGGEVYVPSTQEL